jgi:hypothetical protein
MFDKIKKDIKNTEKNNNNNEEDLPINVIKALKAQENTLSKLEIKEKNFKKMYKYLADKSNKKEDDLLIKKIDQLRIKRELDEITINKTNYYGNYPFGGNWIKNLRSEKNSLFPETTYFNYGEPSNPYYVPIRKSRNKSIDILRDPKSTSKLDYKIIYGSKDLLTDNKTNINDKSTINYSIMNYIQSLNNNLPKNQSVIFEDISSVFSNITTKNPNLNGNLNRKKSLSSLTVNLIIFPLFIFL